MNCKTSVKLSIKIPPKGARYWNEKNSTMDIIYMPLICCVYRSIHWQTSLIVSVNSRNDLTCRQILFLGGQAPLRKLCYQQSQATVSRAWAAENVEHWSLDRTVEISNKTLQDYVISANFIATIASRRIRELTRVVINYFLFFVTFFPKTLAQRKISGAQNSTSSSVDAVRCQEKPLEALLTIINNIPKPRFSE